MKMFGIRTVLAAGALALLGSQAVSATLTCPEQDVARNLFLSWGIDLPEDYRTDVNNIDYVNGDVGTIACLASGTGGTVVGTNYMLANGWAKIGGHAQEDESGVTPVQGQDGSLGLAGYISAAAGGLWGSLSGIMEFDSPGTYETYAVILKFGGTLVPDSWFAFTVDFDGFTKLAFGWSQEGQNNLSHTALWGLNPTTEVPLPAGGVLLLTALGGMALVRRRKLIAA